MRRRAGRLFGSLTIDPDQRFFRRISGAAWHVSQGAGIRNAEVAKGSCRPANALDDGNQRAVDIEAFGVKGHGVECSGSRVIGNEMSLSRTRLGGDVLRDADAFEEHLFLV